MRLHKSNQGNEANRRAVWRDLLEILSRRRGLLAVGFLLMAISRVIGLIVPFSTRFMIDDVIIKGQQEKLPLVIALIVSATIVDALAVYTMEQMITRMGHRLVFELRQKVQRHIGTLPISYHEANKVGGLVSRIMSDLDGMRNLVGIPMFELVGGLTTILVTLFLLLRINAMMTLLVAVFVIAYGYLAKRAFSIFRPLQREDGRIKGEVTGRLTESLGGIRVVKSYHAEDREAQAIAARLTRLLDNSLAMVNTITRVNLVATLVTGILGALVWLVGTRYVLAGSMTVGTLMTFIAFLVYLIRPIEVAIGNGSLLTQALAGLDRTREVLNELPETHDPARTVPIGPIRGHVAFEHVRFSYEAGKEVIKDLSFDAAPGTSTALVGPSGAGKSTVISLLAAFHKPDEGRILVDGIDLSTVRLDTFRTQLGVVLQDSFLFDGTIAENIAFSRPSATMEEIIEACRIAHVDEFVERFDNKYDTVVGERGVKLSGGQRQRASIARAILADPRILILDEATSSLDSESEEFIQEGLKFLMKNRTTVVIAHRLSTIRQADQILVLDQGKIVEQGTHESLCRLGKFYWNMYSCQRGMEENLFLVPGQGDGANAMTQVGSTDGFSRIAKPRR